MANVAAGDYVLIAKTTIVQTQNKDESGADIVCTLDAGATSDAAELEVGQKKGGTERGTLEMQLTKSFSSTGTVLVRCNSAADFDVVARGTTIIALNVGAVTRTAVTG